MLRRTLPVCTGLGGSYSRMMDLGGVPISKVKGDAYKGSLLKNLKVRGILLDFHLVRTGKGQAASEPGKPSSTSSSSSSFMQALNPLKAAVSSLSSPSPPSPVASVVSDFAALLKVQLGSTATFANPSAASDDLSLLGVERPRRERPASPPPAQQEDPIYTTSTRPNSSLLAVAEAEGAAAFKLTQASKSSSVEDVRLKYGSKLLKKGVGLSGLESVVNADSTTTSGGKGAKAGDASFHLSARAMALRIDDAEATAGESSGRWMVANGMGTFMNFVSDRALKVGLVASDKRHEGKLTVEEMDAYVKQLGHHEFHYVGRDISDKGDDKNAESIVQAINKMKGEGEHVIELGPQHLMVVSDRDDLLKAARNVGKCGFSVALV